MSAEAGAAPAKPTEETSSGKPNVLVLGGCGFIGRNLVKFLVDNGLAGQIRVVDKNLPATSYLNASHKKAFESKNVAFMQADLTREAHVQKAFKDVKFDYVVNLCGETRFGCSEDEYKKKCEEPAKLCGAAALEAKVSKFVEVSTAQIYDPEKKNSSEDGKLAPWTILAKVRLAAEQDLQKLKGLPLVILRPAYVYGPGDLTSITPRIVCSAVYQERKEKMKFLWDKGLKLNVVHIDDMVGAIWHACTTSKAGSVFNVVDESDADQGKINSMLGELFGIETGFVGNTLSGLASKVSLAAVAEEANDKHVPGWTQLCQKHKILNTNLSPYIDKELLKNNNLSIVGTALAKDGFKLKHPTITKELLEETIKGFIEQGVFPAVLAKKD